MFLLSKLSFKVIHLINSNTSQIIWSIVFSLASFLILAIFFSGLIGIIQETIKKKRSSLKTFFISIKNYTLTNFILLVILTILYSLITLISLYLGGLFLKINDAMGQIAFLILLFGGLAGFMIFFSFANIFCVTHKLDVIKSLKSSFNLVKKEYLSVLSISVIFFVINELISLIKEPYAEIIKTLIVLPYLALILVNFINSEQ
ncbi:hypothetical protein COU54_00680 [Candidatus Pacearchaeota archaeon CG10_big_fil_rev_8_21_14_0_10_31_24]|nr:MAG: hypothetical protein COU54_00680 [Candidatus Pacearchaeota archaeon CG10_big_fil_rev_8_21_14_0_10_31_24]